MHSKMKGLAKRVIPKGFWPSFVVWYVKLRYYALFFVFAGTAVQCPFCGGHFRRFLPDRLDIPALRQKNVTGGGYEFALCPRCHSSFRERLVYLYLRYKTTVFHDSFKVLHIAPERNLQKALRGLPNLAYVSADLDSPLAAVRMDITDIAYVDDVFDVIVCNHVLEHIPDDRKAMSELRRILKPGGWAILQVPVSLSAAETDEDALAKPKEREKLFGQSDHVRIYGRDYQDRLEEVGFSVRLYNFAGEFGEALSQRYGLQKEEDIYICSKCADS